MTIVGMEKRIIRQGAIDDRALRAARAETEEERVYGCQQRRLYYRGDQFRVDNELARQAFGCKPGQHLPEHLRKHAYSTQISECIDFLADRLGDGFGIEANADVVQGVIDSAVAASDAVRGIDDDGEEIVVTDDLLRDALQTGDVAAYVGWDPIERRVYWEFWEGETVEFVQETTRRVDKVIRRETVWRDVDGQGLREVEERHEYEMRLNPWGAMEAVVEVWWDEEEAPRSIEWLAVGALPWSLLRCDAKGIRVLRGEPLITTQAMETADRYNAVEHVGWLIARYNSHGNLAVIGDGATLKMEHDGRLHKDVADVLTFPGGTSISALTLPTDPQMIEHQRHVLSDAMYSVFGLTRVDADSLSGMSRVSGYALEIMNQRAEATFKRVKRRWRKDFTALLSLTLDVHAWRSAEPDLPEADDDEILFLPSGDDVAPFAWWEVDPAAVYPDRKVALRMGSGYIVDDVMVRDDFVAGLISLEEALRQRGTDPEKIKEIIEEIDERKAKAAAAAQEAFMGGGEGGSTGSGSSGTGTSGSQRAGSTVAGSTDRPETTEE